MTIHPAGRVTIGVMNESRRSTISPGTDGLPPSLPFRTVQWAAVHGQTITLTELPLEEARSVIALYRLVCELSAAVAVTDVHRDGLTPTIARCGALADQIVRCAQARRSGACAPRVARILHDLRGGALTALVGRIGLLARRTDPEAAVRDLEQALELTSIHRRVMRTTVVDLDDRRHEEDGPCGFTTRDLVRMWDGVHGFDGREVQIATSAGDDTVIALCGAERSMLERVFFNFLTNAARHTADATVTVTVTTTADGQDARWLVANAIADEQMARLCARFGADTGRLFEGGFTTDGHGLGLRTAAELVGSIYGLEDFRQAVTHHYVGTALGDGTFRSWFHWPLPSLLRRWAIGVAGAVLALPRKAGSRGSPSTRRRRGVGRISASDSAPRKRGLGAD